MIVEFKYKPVVNWPTKPTANRLNAPFRAKHTDTINLLRSELKALSARNIVIQTYHAERDIRLDGLPYADARKPAHPGVIVTFDSAHGPLSYPCDRFRDWQDNLRAIALALEALRKVDRYGVTKRGEQYKGWKQLPPVSDVLLPKDAAEFIAPYSSFAAADILSHKPTFEAAYKQAASRLHPDNQETGNLEMFKRLTQANAILKESFKR